jgi:hypothetical protein
MTATNLLSSQLPSASCLSLKMLCTLASTSLCDALAVAMSGKHSQNFPRITPWPVRNAGESAALSLSALGLRKEISHSTKSKALSQCVGSSQSNLKPIVPEEIQQASQRFLCCVNRAVSPKANLSHRRAAQTRVSKCFLPCEGISSVAASCTRLSNAPAHVGLSLQSG